MTAQEMDALVQGVFDNIFNSATKAEPGEKPILPSSSTMLTLMKPGMAINPNDFRNPWTPGNNTGSQDAAVNTARLVDTIPNANSLYENSGNEISKIYEDLLNSVSIPVQPKDPKIEAQLHEAHSKLYRTVSLKDPDTGETAEKEVETREYRDYLDNEVNYQNARMAYIQAYSAAQETPQGRNTWPLIAPTLQIPVKQAYDKWRSNKANIIEQSIAIMSASSQNGLQIAFNKAKTLFDGYGVTLDEPVGFPQIFIV